MKQIPLTKGKFALVDDEDYDWAMQYKWHTYSRKNSPVCYAKRSVWMNGKTKSIRMHIELMNSEHPIDHKDGDGLNNQKSNLRECTPAQNSANHRSRRGIKYVGIDSYRGKFRARISHKNKVLHLGTFATLENAIEVRNKKALELRGEFAQLITKGL